MKRTKEFLQAHIRPPRPSRSFSVLLVRTAHLFTYRSSRVPSPIPYSIPLLVVSVPAFLRLFKLASQQVVLCPVSHLTANTVSLANDIGRRAVDRPSGIVVPRAHISSSLACQSFIAWRIHVRCACTLGIGPFGIGPRPCHRKSPLHSSARELALMNTS